MSSFLPEPLPNDPVPLFADWFREARARAVQPNPDAMVLATVDERGRPAARVVLCKQLVLPAGYVVFFTNYESPKGRALIAQQRAAVVFHWDALSRQVRLEGPVVKSPPKESEEYFASRPIQSRIGAWASAQSQPLASRAQLALQVSEAAKRFGASALLSASANTQGSGVHVPRPPHWGGFRLWPDALELWVEGPGRIHDRARWTRSLARADQFSFAVGEWQGSRLNP
jgi:pyridoxamine 5'-phosphate oxidase